jgi:hypothetical protein
VKGKKGLKHAEFMFRPTDSRRGEGWSEQGGGRGLYPAPATGPEGMRIFAHIIFLKKGNSPLLGTGGHGRVCSWAFLIRRRLYTKMPEVQQGTHNHNTTYFPNVHIMSS